MKKVLWICNIMLPAIARQLGLPYSNREGWLTGIFEQLTAEKENRQIEPGICFPVEDGQKEGQEEGKAFKVKGVSCYAFRENVSCPEKYDASMEVRFQEIFRDFQPDMIHIFGTEFPHALAAAKAFGRPERTLIGIQGLCGEIAKVYMAGLPDKVCRRVTFRDFIRKDSLKRQQEKFVLRGEHEKEAVCLAGHITGRTRFDREGTKKINPKAIYHSMNETMRGSFYSGQWELEKCERHRIFLGQGDYPLKGFHFVLEAMPDLLQRYPDAMLYVAGNNIIKHQTMKDRIKLSSYGKYLISLIGQYHLEEKVILLGKLSEEEMKQQFLKANVFVCPSVLENSPNTLGEAMLLGVPSAASAAGGIPDMITDGKEGLLFEPGDVKGLAAAVEALWQEERDGQGRCFSQRLSKGARLRAHTVHDGAGNYNRLMEIYCDILGEASGEEQ